MKTVKITIELDVPDNTTYVAVDSNGCIAAFDSKPIINEPRGHPWDGFWCARHSSLLDEKVVPTNWKETLVEVSG